MTLEIKSRFSLGLKKNQDSEKNKKDKKGRQQNNIFRRIATLANIGYRKLAGIQVKVIF
jgi:hypothetical protein